MLKKKLSILFILTIFTLTAIFFIPYDKEFRIAEVKSPIKFIINNEEFILNNMETFDKTFTEHNLKLAKELNISEEEAFLLGNLGYQWAESLMKSRRVFVKNNSDIIFNKYSYKEKFLHSGFCLINSKPYNYEKFKKRLNSIKYGNFKVYDLDTQKIYNPSDTQTRKLKNFIVIRKSHLPKQINNTIKNHPVNYDYGSIKILIADSTSNLKPQRTCSSLICKEILNNINNAKESIDMAIYGYSRVYEIEQALTNAKNRGVKIRIVLDSDSKGVNIYPDTHIISNLIPNNMTDKNSIESKNIMHNKFYIFDNSILITGSANLSHTDMSGFNTNSIIVINSKEISKLYKQEFEQMFSGKFHNEKQKTQNNKFIISNIPMEVYFSPQDKAITNAVLPLIRKAKKYIYIPTFVLTEKRVMEELIKAKNRGIEIKIIIDALSASNTHSKHSTLRSSKIPVKTENYAGKMHSKSILIDDEYTIIGSMNFSYSGENRNDENLILIKDTKITKFYKEFFLQQWNKIDDKWLNLDPKSEGIDSIGSCFDGIDNDYDGKIDSKDEGCFQP